MFKTSQNLTKDKVFNTLKLIETYLPDIMKKVHQKLKEPKTMDWCENESRKLKAAMEFFREGEFMKDPNERWARVAGFVNTKTVNECKEEVDFMKVS